MEKKTLKVREVLAAYQVLKDAKYQKLDDSSRIKLWKLVRQLKHAALEYEDARKDATATFIPADFPERLAKAQAYEKAAKDGSKELPLSQEEHDAIALEFHKYNNLLKQALDEQLDKELTLDAKPLTEEVFSQLMGSNDWTFEQVGQLEWMIA